MERKPENVSMWDEMASDYDGFTSPEDSYSNSIEWTAVRSLLPVLENTRVLDIGCGSGRFSFYFENCGPSEIIGMDQSTQMLSLARGRLDSGSAVRFVEGGAEDLSAFESNRFDFVFSSTTMHYVSDLEKAFGEAFRVLKPGGELMLSLIHPLYSASYPVKGCRERELRYLDRSIREYVQPWTRFNGRDEKVLCRSFHYTLADYINPLIGCGFILLGVHEPPPPEQWLETRPRRYEDVIREPIYMIIRAAAPAGWNL